MEKLNEDIFLEKILDYPLIDRLIYITRCFNKHSIKSDLNNSLNITLSTEYSKTIELIRERYSIDFFIKHISNQTSILEVDNFFLISPLVFNFETWKELIYYELSLLNKKEISFYLNFYISKIKELINRTGNNCFINYEDLFIDYLGREELYLNGFRTGYGNMIFGIESFNAPYSKYIDFLYNLDFDKLWDFEKNNLNKRIDNLEKLFTSNKVKFKNKIILNTSYTQKNILKLFNTFNSYTASKMNSIHFINNFTTYQVEMSKKHYINSDVDKAEVNYTVEDLNEFISFFKFLKEKKVINSSNSDRKIATIIYNYIDDCKYTTQTIRKKLSLENKLELSKIIRQDLNYYLK